MRIESQVLSLHARGQDYMGELDWEGCEWVKWNYATAESDVDAGHSVQADQSHSWGGPPSRI